MLNDHVMANLLLCLPVIELRKSVNTWPMLIRGQMDSAVSNGNKKGQLSLTNPRDACEKFAWFT